MTSLTNSAELLVYFGGPFCGKTLQFFQKQKNTHERVDVPQILDSHPDLNLRQIINKFVISVLAKDKSVVIDDENLTLQKRQAFVSLARRKIPGISCKCEILQAKHGEEQQLWAHEHKLAEMVLQGKLSEIDNASKTEARISEWASESDTPDTSEGFKISQIILPLKTQSAWQFEVPALFIQYDAIVTKKKEGGVTKGVVEAINIWQDTNPCGRVIVILDSSNFSGGSASENLLKNVSEEIGGQLTSGPLYGLHLDNSLYSGTFCLVPKPGALVFLQRLHHLNLQSKSTMMLYHTPQFMKAAEKAGVRTIKASRVFANPKLAKSSHATSTAEVPPLLSELVLVPAISEHLDTDKIPLYDKLKESGDTKTCVSLNCGRRLYVSVKDSDILERYQQLYSDNATRLQTTQLCSVSGGGISQLCRQSSTPSTSNTSQLPSSRQPSTSFTEVDRPLPKWMVTTQEKEGDRSGISDKEATERGTSSSASKTKKPPLRSYASTTVYIMSQEELVETAKSVLLEAGACVPTDEEIALSISQGGNRISASLEETAGDIEATGMSLKDTETKHTLGNLEDRHKTTMDAIDDFFDNELQTPKKKKPPPTRSSKSLHSISDSVEDTSAETLPQDVRHAEASTMFIHESVTSNTNNSKKTDFDFKVPKILAKNTSSDRSTRSSKSSSLGSRKTIADSLVLNTESGSSSRTVSSISKVSDSLVKDTGSSRSTRSVHSSVVVSDSLVKDTGSTRSSKSIHSSVIVSDSLVKDTPSIKTSSCSRSNGSNSVIPNSLVKDTPSTKSSRGASSNDIFDDLVNVSSTSTKSSIKISDSLVKDSSSQNGSAKSSAKISDSLVIDSDSQRSSGANVRNAGSGKDTVSDSLVRNTSSTSNSSLKRSFSGTDRVSDSLVLDSVETIPDSLEDKKEDTGKKKKKAKSKDLDLSILDDLF